MNVLEKILKEIEEATFQEDCPIYVGDMEVDGYVRASKVKEIIRSHMGEAASEADNDLISRKVLKEETESLRMTITGMRNGKTMTGQALEEYKKSILKIIDEQPCCSKDTNVSTNDRWIPVSERLPEEHDSIFAKFKGTDKWSNAMFEKESDNVNITYEFEDGTRKTATSYTIDREWKLEHRIPKKKVIAWQPLPTPYKGELNPEDIPHTCDTCRRYGKSDHNCYYCRHKERPDLWETKEKAHE